MSMSLLLHQIRFFFPYIFCRQSFTSQKKEEKKRKHIDQNFLSCLRSFLQIFRCVSRVFFKDEEKTVKKYLGKRYKNTHQKQLLLHQRCPQLFLLPRGECLFSVLSLFLIGGRCRIVFSRDWISKREERGRRGKEKKKRWRGLFLNRARSCVDLNRKPRAWWFLVNLFYA